MSANVQESTTVREGKTYGYQGQRETTATAPATAPGSGLEQQKQKLMTDIEAFLDSLVGRVSGGAEGGAPTTTPTTAPSGATGTSTAGAPTTGAASTGAPATGTASTGAPTTGTAPTGAPASGATGAASTGAPATGTGAAPRPGEQPGTEASAAVREAYEKSLFVQREAYRIDREREAARASRREAAAKSAAPVPAAAVAEAAALKHRPDSNRAPLVESREFAPAFGSMGRGQAMTMERMSVPAMQRPETVPLPGAVSGRPIDAYWASYGTAIERAAVRAQADRQTNVILETIIGTDDRIKVTNNQAYPWRCICSLLITAQSGTQYIGTGWLVAPRVVLTAGHCVYMADEGGWATQIEVMPGRNGSDRPYGSAICRDLRSVSGWTQDNDSNCDYGAILLPADKRYGEQLGWFGYAVRDDDYLRQVTLNLSGYPGDGGRTGEDGTQWFMSRGVKEVMDHQITYEIDTYGGQSGSPVWEMSSNGSRYGVGIHTWGTSVSNGATRIVSEVFQNIVSWAAEAP